MSAWIATHTSLLLFLLVVVHATMQSLHAAYPNAKLPAIWAGVMPLDVIKTLKAIGVELAVPLSCLALCLGLCLAGCVKQTPPPETPTLDAARVAEHSAATAFYACLATTGVADKLAGDNSLQVTLDEVRTCGPDLLALARAEVQLHAAEQAALATVDAGAQ